MERERLTRLLDDPGRMTRDDAAELRAMAERFPWFSGAQLLRAAGEHVQGNVLADETVRVAAAHLPSRSVLHDLVERGSEPAPLRVVKTVPLPAPTVEVQAVAAPTPETEAPTEAKTEAAPVVLVEEPAQTATGPAEVVLQEQIAKKEAVGPVPEARVEAATPAPEPEAVAEATSAQEEIAAEDALDHQITQAALASAFDLTLLEPPPLAATVDQPPTPAAPAPAEHASPDSRLRFTAWLDDASEAPAAGEAKPAAAKASSPDPAPKAAEPRMAATEGTGPEADAAPKAKAAGTGSALAPTDLIDRFIRQQPPEIPPKPAFFNPQQAAKKSLDDTAGLVTETLARIYEKQGNTAKAIETYRRLALKYPEKSSYFAALSKALEDQQTT